MTKKTKTIVIVALLAAVSIFAAVKFTHSVKSEKPAMADPGGGNN